MSPVSVVTINLEPLVPLTDDAFYTLCRANPEVKFERTSVGELMVMPPTGGESGSKNRRLTQHLGNWTDEDGTGEAFDSSTMFQLPNVSVVQTLAPQLNQSDRYHC